MVQRECPLLLAVGIGFHPCPGISLLSQYSYHSLFVCFSDGDPLLFSKLKDEDFEQLEKEVSDNRQFISMIGEAFFFLFFFLF